MKHTSHRRIAPKTPARNNWPEVIGVRIPARVAEKVRRAMKAKRLKRNGFIVAAIEEKADRVNNSSERALVGRES